MSINGVEIAHLTNRYRKLDGHWYRAAWSREADGSLRSVYVLRKLVEQ